jgi:plastocyanin
MRRSRLALVALASLSLVFAVSGSAAASRSERRVNMLDDCDAASFNAVLGPGACTKAGGVTFEELVGQLLSMGRAPAWRFAPAAVKLPSGGSIEAYNRGGEFHTFTEVANFGGGCVPDLNAPLGLNPVPECANPSLFGTTGAAPGDEVETGPLAAGTHKFMCLIHPWMRTTVVAR